MDIYAHCEALVREADKDRYLASLFAPVGDRPHLFALYAFNVEVARIRQRVSEPLAGEVRLQWWRDALGGAPAGDVQRNPVSAALLRTIADQRLPVEPLTELVEARRLDLDGEPVVAPADLEVYLRATRSSIFALAARILGDERSSIAAEAAGLAYGLAEILSALAQPSRRAQIFVPLDISGEAARDLAAGRSTPEVADALRRLSELARRRLDEFETHRPAISQPALAAFLPVSLVEPYLARLERAAYDPSRATDLPQWRRQWILWRTARKWSRPSRRAGGGRSG